MALFWPGPQVYTRWRRDPRMAGGGCGTPPPLLGAGGEGRGGGEGKVVVAGPRSAPVRKGLSEPFEKRFGISVEYQGMSGVELASRVKAERTAGQYLWDVYIGAITAAVSDYKPIGGLDPLEPALILPVATDPKSWFGNALA